jgi:hypothetical protein
MEKELREEFRELARILAPKALKEIELRMSRLYERCEELERSRNSWRDKYNQLKSESGRKNK